MHGGFEALISLTKSGVHTNMEKGEIYGKSNNRHQIS